jgi:hypothetical protein
MEIIHATTVAGRALIRRWQENDGSEELDGFFWRQRLDIMTKKLTVCSSPLSLGAVAIRGRPWTSDY